MTPAGETAPAAPDEPEVVTAGLDLRLRLRVAAAIALGAGALFLVVAASDSSLPRSALQLAWGLHTAIDLLALAATFAPLSIAQLDRIVVAVVLAHIANAHLYLWLSPTDPVLVADGLTCLLMVGGVFFSWSGRRMLAVALCACLAFAVVGWLVTPDDGRRGAFPIALGALVVGSIIAIASAELLARLRQRLSRRQVELTALSARLMSVQEDERRRLARELHDEFGQSLTAVNAYLWLIERQGAQDPAVLRARAAEARHVIASTLGAMRELSQLLRPAVLDEFGLVPSLEEHLKSFGERHQIATSLTADGLPARLPAEVETALYRITQEALTNVARHARASGVRVVLRLDRERLRLEVTDDGVGLPDVNGVEVRGGTGLVGIRERAHALGGTLVVTSERGTRIRVEVPLRPA